MYRHLTIISALIILMVGVLTLAFGTQQSESSTQCNLLRHNLALATNGAVATPSTNHASGNYLTGGWQHP